MGPAHRASAGNGKSIRSLGDTIQIGAAELILRNTVPRAFTDGQHPFDYCNTAQLLDAHGDSPYQPRVLYLMANFVNDAARANKWSSSGDRAGIRRFDDLASRTPEALLRELDEAILAFDIPRVRPRWRMRICRSGADRKQFMATVAVTACKFQDDPHNQKITPFHVRGVWHNSTHLRDRLLLATVRQLAGWPKMPGERDCYARFMKEWIRH